MSKRERERKKNIFIYIYFSFISNNYYDIIIFLSLITRIIIINIIYLETNEQDLNNIYNWLLYFILFQPIK